MSFDLIATAGVRVAALDRAAIDEVPGAWDRMVGGAIRFLRVGSLSWTDWVGLSPVEQEAFQEAAEVVLAERAAVVGAAAQSPEAALAVGAKSDGGSGLAEALLRTAVVGMARGEPARPSVPVEGP